MAAQPFVSVVICTRDRAASLARTLESIVVAASHLTDPWEILVVDNGSTDSTAATIGSFASRLPIRRVWQAVAGLSNARNAGVAEAAGDYILWTDDDVIVDHQWLAAWFQAFREYPQMAIFGGRATPVYEEPHEPWFKANEWRLDGLLAIRDEPEWVEITEDKQPFGLNYAVRGDEQRRHLYDPGLGVAPNRRRGGEESAVIQAILESGGTGRWVWTAHVHHFIPLERQTPHYIRQYYEAVSFDFPMCGLPEGPVHRLKSIWSASKRMLKATLLAATLNRRAREEAVRWFIWQGRSLGSLRRYVTFSE